MTCDIWLFILIVFVYTIVVKISYGTPILNCFIISAYQVMIFS